MLAYFHPTRRSVNKEIGVTCPPPAPKKIEEEEEEKIGLILKLAVLSNPGSIQLSLSQAKADPSIAWARLFDIAHLYLPFSFEVQLHRLIFILWDNILHYLSTARQ